VNPQDRPIDRDKIILADDPPMMRADRPDVPGVAPIRHIESGPPGILPDVVRYVGRMPKASAQAETRDTRVRLVRAAQHVIAEDGWAAVTTRRVAARAEVNPGLVHYHFAGVADLQREAVSAVLKEMGSAASEAIPNGSLTEVGLRDLLTGWLDLQSTDPTAAAVLQEGSMACLHDESLREEIRRMLSTFRDAIQRWLADTGHSPQDARRLAVLTTAALDGVALHNQIDPAVDPTDVIEPLLALTAATTAPLPARTPAPPSAAPAAPQPVADPHEETT